MIFGSTEKENNLKNFNFRRFFSSRYSDVGESLASESQMTLDVLADDGLLVVAGHVVPLDPVPVEVVQHGHTGLTVASLLDLFSVVRLSARRLEPAGE